MGISPPRAKRASESEILRGTGVYSLRKRIHFMDRERADSSCRSECRGVDSRPDSVHATRKSRPIGSVPRVLRIAHAN